MSSDESDDETYYYRKQDQRKIKGIEVTIKLSPTGLIFPNPNHYPIERL